MNKVAATATKIRVFESTVHATVASKMRSGGYMPVELNLILVFVSTDACNWPTRSVRLFRLANIDLLRQRVGAKETDDDGVTYSE